MSPMLPRRPCAGSPTCPNLVSGQTTRCPQHARQYEQRRGTPSQRGYDVRWAQVSRDFRRRFPWCGMRADGQFHTDGGSECARRGVRTRADTVDHLVSMRMGGRRYDEANLEAKCRRCNTVKANTTERR